MLQSILRKLVAWMHDEWEQATYHAAMTGAGNGINRATRELTGGNVTDEIHLDGSTLRLSEAVQTSAKPTIDPTEINGLRRKADALELADQHGIEIDPDATLSEMKETLHAATTF